MVQGKGRAAGALVYCLWQQHVASTRDRKTPGAGQTVRLSGHISARNGQNRPQAVSEFGSQSVAYGLHVPSNVVLLQ